MPAGKHSPEGDRSFWTSVAWHVAASLALVAVVTAAFWGLGRLRAPPGNPVIAVSPTTSATQPHGVAGRATGSPSPDGEASPATPATSVPSPVGPSPAPTAPMVDPAQISVQVLDAAGDQGGRTRAAIKQLRADGYNVAATNKAYRVYARSTVFYTPGHEAEARQLAATYPWLTRVDKAPGNLSTKVYVHVVIGKDHPGS